MHRVSGDQRLDLLSCTMYEIRMSREQPMIISHDTREAIAQCIHRCHVSNVY